MIAPSEFLQGDECSLVSHLGKRVRAPKTNILGYVIEIFAENTMRLRPVVMREGLRGLSSDLRVFSPIRNGPLKRYDGGFAVH